MPWPSKSTAMVSLDRVSVSDSTVRSTVARIGPSIPWTPQVLGGSICVTAEVDDRFFPPMRRVVEQRAPTCGVPEWSIRPLTTPFCHWSNRVGSMA